MSATTFGGLLPVASFKRASLASRMMDGRIPTLNAYYIGKHEQARDLYLVRARHETKPSVRCSLVNYARSEHHEYLRWAFKRGAK
jgi:hypothetical protein